MKQLRLQVESELTALTHILREFEAIYDPRIDREHWLQSQLALAEGFTNAVRHAHKYLPKAVPIEIEVTLTETTLEMRIWDCGPFFDLEDLVSKTTYEPQKIIQAGGQGLVILKKVADKLSYRRTEDDRNCLAIIKLLNKLV